MRILFWTELFWPSIGGMEVLATQMIPALQAKGHEFCVVTSHGNLGLPDLGDFQGVPIHRFYFQRAIAQRDLKAFVTIQKRLTELKRSFKPDVVHVNYCDPSILFHMRTAAAHPAPTAISIQAFLETIPDGGSLQVQAFRFSDWIVALSSEILNAARAQVPEITAKSSIIHPCCNQEPATPLRPVSFDPLRLLCLGRLAREKGFDLALQAFPTVLQRFPSARLIISGDGPERAALEELARTLGVSQSVEFTGWISKEPEQGKIFDLISTATLVIMPSRWMEPFGLVALHAAQCARPIVATRTGGLMDIVADGETGLLFERGSAQDLSRAVCDILADPARAQAMGIAARQRAAAKFPWSGFIDAHDELYRKLATRGAS